MNKKTLMKERDNLEKAIVEIQNRLLKSPSGNISVINRKSGEIAFYQGTDENSRNLKYISKNEEQLIIQLLQKRYDRLMLPLALKQLKTIDCFLKNYKPEDMKNQIMKINTKCRHMVEVYDWPDKEYEQAWKDFKYSGNPYPMDDNALTTNNGEKVRSKSEYIIANCLFEAKVPYRYEPPVEVGFGKTIYPDFAILNTETREEVYWEHFGRIDSESYREKMFKKLASYSSIGRTVGQGLIVTFEDFNNPINIQLIRQIIRNSICEQYR